MTARGYWRIFAVLLSVAALVGCKQGVPTSPRPIASSVTELPCLPDDVRVCSRVLRGGDGTCVAWRRCP